MAAPTGAAITVSAQSPSMRRRFALVFNSKAGHAVPRLLDGVLDIVRQSGAQVFQLPARNAAEAAERVSEAAQQGGCDAVIAAGGDGTFRAVAPEAALPSASFRSARAMSSATRWVSGGGRAALRICCSRVQRSTCAAGSSM